MHIMGSESTGKPASVPDQFQTAVTPPVSAHVDEPAATLDEIVIADSTRISLLMPPRDGANLAQLQQAVFSGKYGPPAATIAEALIELAIARGLRT